MSAGTPADDRAKGIFPVSCAERLLLGILSSRGIAFPCLYHASFLSFTAILDGIGPEGGLNDFHGFRSLFDLAGEEGLISVSDRGGEEFTGENVYRILGVTEEFARAAFPSSPWKKHCVLVSAEGGCSYGMPGAVFGGELPAECRTGEDTTVRLLSDSLPEKPSVYADRFYEILARETPRYGAFPGTAAQLRDGIGILLLSRRRITALLECAGYDVTKIRREVGSILSLYRETGNALRTGADRTVLSVLRTKTMEEDEALIGQIVRTVDR